MSKHTTQFTPSILERFWAKVDRFGPIHPFLGTECWLWRGSLTTAGYGQMSTDGILCQAHRLSWEIHLGPIPDGWQCLHKCDRPPCIRPDHLFLGSHQDNMADRDAKNRQARFPGTSNPSARLDETQVRQIREMAEQRIAHFDIAQEFQVSVSLIEKIVARKVWAQVSPEQPRTRRHSHAKLTESDVVEIRHLYNRGILQSDIAARFNISRGNVASIVTRQIWANVAPEQPYTPHEHIAKVTEDDVREIRRLAALGITQREIAERFGVTRANIGLIVSRRNWVHVK